MFFAKEDNNAFKIIFSSKECFVNDAIQLSKKYIARYDIVEADLQKIEALLKELLMNALVHGNTHIEEKSICSSIEYSGWDLVKITVLDEGVGFNYNSLTTQLPENSELSENEGYGLINAITGHLDFNDKGNRVTAYMNVIKESVICAQPRIKCMMNFRHISVIRRFHNNSPQAAILSTTALIASIS